MPKSQSVPSVAQLRQGSMTSVVSSSVTSLASSVTNDIETDTDKGTSFAKTILRKSGKFIFYHSY